MELAGDKPSDVLITPSDKLITPFGAGKITGGKGPFSTNGEEMGNSLAAPPLKFTEEARDRKDGVDMC